MNRCMIAELKFAPDVIPLTTLADLMGVPIALLIDEIIQGALPVVVAFSLGRFAAQPFEMVSSGFNVFPRKDVTDRYLGESPPYYVKVREIKGGSEGLYALLRGGKVEVLSVEHRVAWHDSRLHLSERESSDSQEDEAALEEWREQNGMRSVPFEDVPVAPPSAYERPDYQDPASSLSTSGFESQEEWPSEFYGTPAEEPPEDRDGWTLGTLTHFDHPQDRLCVGLGDLLVSWPTIVHRGWASRIFPATDGPEAGADDPTADERTIRRNRSWVRRARSILRKRPELARKDSTIKWKPLAEALCEELHENGRPTWKHLAKILREHWDEPS